MPLFLDQLAETLRREQETPARPTSGEMSQSALLDRGTERQGYFAHELRNLLGNAILAFEVLKTGTVGVSGSTGGILGRNLIALRDLIDRSLAEVRLEAGAHHREHVLLNDLIEGVELSASIEAKARGCSRSHPWRPG